MISKVLSILCFMIGKYKGFKWLYIGRIGLMELFFIFCNIKWDVEIE